MFVLLFFFYNSRSNSNNISSILDFILYEVLFKIPFFMFIFLFYVLLRDLIIFSCGITMKRKPFYTYNIHIKLIQLKKKKKVASNNNGNETV